MYKIAFQNLFLGSMPPDLLEGLCLWHSNRYQLSTSWTSQLLLKLMRTLLSFQAIPIALSGRDIIGIAKTGSGKTAAFLWPALVHIMDQPELEPDDGPIALICAPTRELCQQIFVEARRFGKVYNIHAAAVFGGGNKYEQSKALQEGAEIVVATPVSKLFFIQGIFVSLIIRLWAVSLFLENTLDVQVFSDKDYKP